MFWNLFKSKEAPQQQVDNESYDTWICYGIDKDGLSIDINIADVSKKSLDDFAKLLAGISTMSLFPETLAIIKNGLIDEPEAYEFLIEKAVEYAKYEISKIIGDIPSLQDSDSSEPIVKPSDIIK